MSEHSISVDILGNLRVNDLNGLASKIDSWASSGVNIPVNLGGLAKDLRASIAAFQGAIKGGQSALIQAAGTAFAALLSRGIRRGLIKDKNGALGIVRDELGKEFVKAAKSLGVAYWDALRDNAMKQSLQAVATSTKGKLRVAANNDQFSFLDDISRPMPAALPERKLKIRAMQERARLAQARWDKISSGTGLTVDEQIMRDNLIGEAKALLAIAAALRKAQEEARLARAAAYKNKKAGTKVQPSVTTLNTVLQPQALVILVQQVSVQPQAKRNNNALVSQLPLGYSMYRSGSKLVIVKSDTATGEFAGQRSIGITPKSKGRIVGKAASRAMDGTTLSKGLYTVWDLDMFLPLEKRELDYYLGSKNKVRTPAARSVPLQAARKEVLNIIKTLRGPTLRRVKLQGETAHGSQGTYNWEDFLSYTMGGGTAESKELLSMLRSGKIYKEARANPNGSATAFIKTLIGEANKRGGNYSMEFMPSSVRANLADMFASMDLTSPRLAAQNKKMLQAIQNESPYIVKPNGRAATTSKIKRVAPGQARQQEYYLYDLLTGQIGTHMLDESGLSRALNNMRSRGMNVGKDAMMWVKASNMGSYGNRKMQDFVNNGLYLNGQLYTLASMPANEMRSGMVPFIRNDLAPMLKELTWGGMTVDKFNATRNDLGAPAYSAAKIGNNVSTNLTGSTAIDMRQRINTTMFDTATRTFLKGTTSLIDSIAVIPAQAAGILTDVWQQDVNGRMISETTKSGAIKKTGNDAARRISQGMTDGQSIISLEYANAITGQLQKINKDVQGFATGQMRGEGFKSNAVAFDFKRRARELIQSGEKTYEDFSFADIWGNKKNLLDANVQMITTAESFKHGKSYTSEAQFLQALKGTGTGKASKLALGNTQWGIVNTESSGRPEREWSAQMILNRGTFTPEELTYLTQRHGQNFTNALNSVEGYLKFTGIKLDSPTALILRASPELISSPTYMGILAKRAFTSAGNVGYFDRGAAGKLATDSPFARAVMDPFEIISNLTGTNIGYMNSKGYREPGAIPGGSVGAYGERKYRPMPLSSSQQKVYSPIAALMGLEKGGLLSTNRFPNNVASLVRQGESPLLEEYSIGRYGMKGLAGRGGAKGYGGTNNVVYFSSGTKAITALNADWDGDMMELVFGKLGRQHPLAKELNTIMADLIAPVINKPAGSLAGQGTSAKLVADSMGAGLTIGMGSNLLTRYLANNPLTEGIAGGTILPENMQNEAGLLSLITRYYADIDKAKAGYTYGLGPKFIEAAKSGKYPYFQLFIDLLKGRRSRGSQVEMIPGQSGVLRGVDLIAVKMQEMRLQAITAMNNKYVTRDTMSLFPQSAKANAKLPVTGLELYAAGEFAKETGLSLTPTTVKEYQDAIALFAKAYTNTGRGKDKASPYFSALKQAYRTNSKTRKGWREVGNLMLGSASSGGALPTIPDAVLQMYRDSGMGASASNVLTTSRDFYKGAFGTLAEMRKLIYQQNPSTNIDTLRARYNALQSLAEQLPVMGTAGETRIGDVFGASTKLPGNYKKFLERVQKASTGLTTRKSMLELDDGRVTGFQITKGQHGKQGWREVLDVEVGRALALLLATYGSKGLSAADIMAANRFDSYRLQPAGSDPFFGNQNKGKSNLLAALGSTGDMLSDILGWQDKSRGGTIYKAPTVPKAGARVLSEFNASWTDGTELPYSIFGKIERTYKNKRTPVKFDMSDVSFSNGRYMMINPDAMRYAFLQANNSAMNEIYTRVRDRYGANATTELYMAEYEKLAATRKMQQQAYNNNRLSGQLLLSDFTGAPGASEAQVRNMNLQAKFQKMSALELTNFGLISGGRGALITEEINRLNDAIVMATGGTYSTGSKQAVGYNAQWEQAQKAITHYKNAGDMETVAALQEYLNTTEMASKMLTPETIAAYRDKIAALQTEKAGISKKRITGDASREFKRLDDYGQMMTAAQVMFGREMVNISNGQAMQRWGADNEVGYGGFNQMTAEQREASRIYQTMMRAAGLMLSLSESAYLLQPANRSYLMDLIAGRRNVEDFLTPAAKKKGATSSKVKPGSGTVIKDLLAGSVSKDFAQAEQERLSAGLYRMFDSEGTLTPIIQNNKELSWAQSADVVAKNIETLKGRVSTAQKTYDTLAADAIRAGNIALAAGHLGANAAEGTPEAMAVKAWYSHVGLQSEALTDAKSELTSLKDELAAEQKRLTQYRERAVGTGAAPEAKVFKMDTESEASAKATGEDKLIALQRRLREELNTVRKAGLISSSGYLQTEELISRLPYQEGQGLAWNDKQLAAIVQAQRTQAATQTPTIQRESLDAMLRTNNSAEQVMSLQNLMIQKALEATKGRRQRIAKRAEQATKSLRTTYLDYTKAIESMALGVGDFAANYETAAAYLGKNGKALMAYRGAHRLTGAGPKEATYQNANLAESAAVLTRLVSGQSAPFQYRGGFGNDVISSAIYNDVISRANAYQANVIAQQYQTTLGQRITEPAKLFSTGLGMRKGLLEQARQYTLADYFASIIGSQLQATELPNSALMAKYQELQRKRAKATGQKRMEYTQEMNRLRSDTTLGETLDARKIQNDIEGLRTKVANATSAAEKARYQSELATAQGKLYDINKAAAQRYMAANAGSISWAQHQLNLTQAYGELFGYGAKTGGATAYNGLNVKSFGELYSGMRSGGTGIIASAAGAAGVRGGLYLDRAALSRQFAGERLNMMIAQSAYNGSLFGSIYNQLAAGRATWRGADGSLLTTAYGAAAPVGKNGEQYTLVGGKRGITGARGIATAASTYLSGISSANMSKMYGGQMLWSHAAGYIQKFYTYTKALNDEMREYQKIQPNWDPKDMEGYVRGLSDIGRQYGKTTSEMANASLTLTRGGYGGSTDKQKQLNTGMTEASILMSNVADEDLSVDDASSSIISAVKAWNIADEQATSFAMHYTDAANELSNNFAVVSNDLTDNLATVASASATNGMTIDLTLALITTGAEISQNASKTATAMKTIIGRFNTVNDESSTTGQWLNEFFSTNGINVRNEEGQLDFYQMVQNMGEYWDKMTQDQQSLFSQKIAGSRQASNWANWMLNIDALEETRITAENAAGSAARSNEAMMDSIEGSQARLSAAAENFYNSAISSDAIITGINALTGALTALGNIPFASEAAGIGSIVLALGALSSFAPTMVKFLGGGALGGIANLAATGITAAAGAKGLGGALTAIGSGTGAAIGSTALGVGLSNFIGGFKNAKYGAPVAAATKALTAEQMALYGSTLFGPGATLNALTGQFINAKTGKVVGTLSKGQLIGANGKNLLLNNTAKMNARLLKAYGTALTGAKGTTVNAAGTHFLYQKEGQSLAMTMNGSAATTAGANTATLGAGIAGISPILIAIAGITAAVVGVNAALKARDESNQKIVDNFNKLLDTKETVDKQAADYQKQMRDIANQQLQSSLKTEGLVEGTEEYAKAYSDAAMSGATEGWEYEYKAGLSAAYDEALRGYQQQVMQQEILQRRIDSQVGYAVEAAGKGTGFTGFIRDTFGGGNFNMSAKKISESLDTYNNYEDAVNKRDAQIAYWQAAGIDTSKLEGTNIYLKENASNAYAEYSKNWENISEGYFEMMDMLKRSTDGTIKSSLEYADELAAQGKISEETAENLRKVTDAQLIYDEQAYQRAAMEAGIEVDAEYLATDLKSVIEQLGTSYTAALKAIEVIKEGKSWDKLTGEDLSTIESAFGNATEDLIGAFFETYRNGTTAEKGDAFWKLAQLNLEGMYGVEGIKELDPYYLLKYYQGYGMGAKEAYQTSQEVIADAEVEYNRLTAALQQELGTEKYGLYSAMKMAEAISTGNITGAVNAMEYEGNGRASFVATDENGNTSVKWMDTIEGFEQSLSDAGVGLADGANMLQEWFDLGNVLTDKNGNQYKDYTDETGTLVTAAEQAMADYISTYTPSVDANVTALSDNTSATLQLTAAMLGKDKAEESGLTQWEDGTWHFKNEKKPGTGGGEEPENRYKNLPTSLIKKQYGNIDISNRELLWNNKEANDYSTVLGSWESYGANGKVLTQDKGGVPIAYSPLLQTGTGTPTMLTDELINSYIGGLIAANGGKVDQGLIELDKTGINGISNLIAAVGDDAPRIAEEMHNAAVELENRGATNYSDLLLENKGGKHYGANESTDNSARGEASAGGVAGATSTGRENAKNTGRAPANKLEAGIEAGLGVIQNIIESAGLNGANGPTGFEKQPNLIVDKNGNLWTKNTIAPGMSLTQGSRGLVVTQNEEVQSSTADTIARNLNNAGGGIKGFFAGLGNYFAGEGNTISQLAGKNGAATEDWRDLSRGVGAGAGMNLPFNAGYFTNGIRGLWSGAASEFSANQFVLDVSNTFGKSGVADTIRNNGRGDLRDTSFGRSIKDLLSSLVNKFTSGEGKASKKASVDTSGIDTSEEGSIKYKAEVENPELPKLKDLHIKITADDEASGTIDKVNQKAAHLDLTKSITVSATDNASAQLLKIADKARNIKTSINIHVAVSGAEAASSKLASLKAGSARGGIIGSTAPQQIGERHADGGTTGSSGLVGTWLGDEYTGSGEKKPELVVTPDGNAHLAGLNGWEYEELPKGTRVFSNSKTKQMLGNRYYSGGFIGERHDTKDREESVVAGGLNYNPFGSSSGSSGSSKGSSSSSSSSSGGTKSGVSGSNTSKESTVAGYVEDIADKLKDLTEKYDTMISVVSDLVKLLEADKEKTGYYSLKTFDLEALQLDILNKEKEALEGKGATIENSKDYRAVLQSIQDLTDSIFEQQVTNMQHEIDVSEAKRTRIEREYEKYGNPSLYVDAIEQALLEEQEAYDMIRQHYLDAGYDEFSDKVLDIEDKIYDTQKEIRNMWKDTLSQIVETFEDLDERNNTYMDYATWLADNEKDKISKEVEYIQLQYDDETELIQKQDKQIERTKRLQDAEADLADAQKKRVMVMTETGWQWKENPEAVRDAQKALDDVKKAIADEKRDDQRAEDLKAEIAAQWEKYYGEGSEGKAAYATENSIYKKTEEISKFQDALNHKQAEMLTQMQYGNFTLGSLLETLTSKDEKDRMDLENSDKLFSSLIQELGVDVKDAIARNTDGTINKQQSIYNVLSQIKYGNLDEVQKTAMTQAMHMANQEEDTIKGFSELISAITHGWNQVQTQFGNIDVTCRQIYKNGETLADGYSTILGGYNSYDGVDVAYSMFAQGEDGVPVKLGDKQIDEYIKWLIDENGGKVDENILELDKVGDGVIKNMIAAVGEDAAQVAELMHYVGTYYDESGLNQNYTNAKLDDAVQALKHIELLAQDANQSAEKTVEATRATAEATAVNAESVKVKKSTSTYEDVMVLAKRQRIEILENNLLKNGASVSVVNHITSTAANAEDVAKAVLNGMTNAFKGIGINATQTGKAYAAANSGSNAHKFGY